MIKISQVTKKAPIKGGINDLIINLCNDFNNKFLCKSNTLSDECG